jgi:uncharacterized protein (DUF2141 family)
LGLTWLVSLTAGAVPARAEETAPPPSTGELRVRVTGLTSDRGEVLVQLANSRTDYERDDDGFRYAAVAVANGQATAVFENVPYGDYAVKAFHDENRNRTLDIGFTGPTEAYGFSNGARGRFGPPDYDKAKFRFAAKTQTIEIAAQ